MQTDTTDDFPALAAEHHALTHRTVSLALQVLADQVRALCPRARYLLLADDGGDLVVCDLLDATHQPLTEARKALFGAVMATAPDPRPRQALRVLEGTQEHWEHYAHRDEDAVENREYPLDLHRIAG